MLITYLQIIFFVDGKAVREDIACNNHVGLISIHGESVNPQKLRQQRVAMALHDELPKERGISIHDPFIVTMHA